MMGGTSPLLADALVRVRAGTVGDAKPDLRVPKMPTCADFDQMEKWEPIVRFYVCLSEVLSDLQLAVVPKVSDTFALQQCVHTPSSAGSLDGSYLSKPIVTITRPHQGVFGKQLRLMQAWAELREDRATEVISEMPPQVPFWSATCNLQPSRHRHTFEFINLALALAAISAFRFKQVFACPRPAAYWAGLQPMLPTPEHSALPSGHATEAFMAARVLSALNGNREGKLFEALMTQASRVAINRTVAGLHFPVDSLAGQKLGNSLAEFLLTQAGAYSTWDERKFFVKPNTNPDYLQRRPKKSYEASTKHLQSTAADQLKVCTPPAASAIQWLWCKALGEWQDYEK